MGGYLRIAAAFVAGSALVGGAVYLRGAANAESAAPSAAAVVSAEPLRTYQYVQDSDGDGIPDWQQELLGPQRDDADSAAVAAEPFEPQTLTDRFAVNFFSSYLLQKGSGGVNQNALINQGLAQVTALNTNTLYTRNDIVISNENSPAHLREYGNQAGSALTTNGTNRQNLPDEITLLNRALQTNDPVYLADLATIKGSYRNMVRDLRQVSVPPSLVNAHLALINSLQAAHDGIAGMELVFDDPLVALIRLKRYPEDIDAVAAAIEQIRQSLESSGVFYNPSEGGAFFFSLRP